MGIIPIVIVDIRGRTVGYYISPHCPSALSDNVGGQGGQSVRLIDKAIINSSRLRLNAFAHAVTKREARGFSKRWQEN